MFCTGCGSKIPDDCRFCTECGKEVVPPAADIEDTLRLEHDFPTAPLKWPGANPAAPPPSPVPAVPQQAKQPAKPAPAPQRPPAAPAQKGGLPQYAVAAAVAVALIVAAFAVYKLSFGSQAAKPPSAQQVSPAPVVPAAKPKPPEIVGQLADILARTRAVGERYYSAKVPGNQARTIANYRGMERGAYDLKGQIPAHPPDGEAAKALTLLRDSLAGFEEAAGVMADYLEGKRSMAPPNPDWVIVADEAFEDAWSKLESAEDALRKLRAKYQ